MNIENKEHPDNELVPQHASDKTFSHKLTAAEIRANVNLIQEVLKAVMKKDVHYGVIPGTPKPTLYKPGAEQIMVTFRLNAEPLIEDLSGPDEIRYRIRMRVTHQPTKMEIGWGVGECSSSETKYKWVGCKFTEEFDAAPEDRKRSIWKHSKINEKPYKVNQVRANISDVANTILKMAKKRALVDAVLTCTAASDVFDQDIEDLPEGLLQNVAEQSRPPMPQRASEKKQPPPPPAPPTPKTEYEDGEDNTEPPAAPIQRRMVDMESARRMKAKFDAPCKICSKQIAKDSEMIYVYEGVDKGAYHVGCVEG